MYVITGQTVFRMHLLSGVHLFRFCQCFPVMGALINNACDGTKAPKRPNVKKTGILSYAPHNEFWSTLRSALSRPLKLSEV